MAVTVEVGSVYQDTDGCVVVVRNVRLTKPAQFLVQRLVYGDGDQKLQRLGQYTVTTLKVLHPKNNWRADIEAAGYSIGVGHEEPDVEEEVKKHWHRGGPDYIERTSVSMTPERFRGAMTWTIGKYCDRFGHKDSPLQEAKKIQDYANRLVEFETAQADNG